MFKLPIISIFRCGYLDGGGVSQTDTQNLIVDVSNVIDETPTVSGAGGAAYTANVDENANPGTALTFTYTVADPDGLLSDSSGIDTLSYALSGMLNI